MHVLVWALAAALAAAVCAAPVETAFPAGLELTESNFTLTSKDAWFVEYFRPKCRFCQRFSPVWADLEREMARERTAYPSAPFTLARVNCDVWMDLCTRQDINSYPTFQLIVDGRTADKDADVDMSFESVSAYIVNASTAFHRDRGVISGEAPAAVPATAKPERPVLTEFGTAALPDLPALKALLGTETGQGATFVKFYASWCPHCQAMAADFHELAERVHDELNVVAVACPEHPDACEAYGIEGYPTLSLFQNGTRHSYSGTRSTQMMHRWLIDSGAAKGYTEVDAAAFDAQPKTRETAFLHITSDESMRRTLGYAAAALPMRANIMLSTDAKLRDRFGGSGLLVFKDGNFGVPAGRYMGQMVPEDVASWLELEWHPTLTAVTGMNLQDILYCAYVLTASNHAIVLAVLPNSSPTEVNRVRSLAVAWRRGTRPSARFAWIETAARDVLASKYHITLPESDGVLVFADPRTQSYAATSFTSESTGLEWLGRAASRDPTVTRYAYGSLLHRGMAHARAAGTEIQGMAYAHPLFGMAALCGVFMLIPRVRRMLFRTMARPTANKMV